jgi:hypothetical protein
MNYFLNFVASRGKVCPMARPKMALEQRLNFWVSQETYDFYAKLAIRRKQKISEFLRIVLDKATDLMDENGNFHADLPMSKEDLQRMMREVAAEEVAKAAALHTHADPPAEDPYVAEARKAAENTLRRDEARSVKSDPEPAASSTPTTYPAKRRRIIEQA